jgi:GDP-D-mannose 3',5'-epimerase
MKKALVAGAGGFIGGHLVEYLKEKGYWVRGADIKEHEFRETAADEFLLRDLRRWEACLEVMKDIDEVYQLAANMGGIGFIEVVKAEVVHDNVLINTHMLEAARQCGVKRYLFSSSACVYPTYRQEVSDIPGLRESEAYPADPDNEYGWEKLITERLCLSYYADYGLETRIARFHNIYGPYGTWTGGREKAPAAICRKVAEANDGATIEIWGDGEQTRSFCYIDDCLEGTYRLTQSEYREPLNIGSDEMVTINQLIDYAVEVAGKRMNRRYDTTKPQGVRGRNSDNTLIEHVLGWRPSTTLRDGIAKTYPWIELEVQEANSSALR